MNKQYFATVGSGTLPHIGNGPAHNLPVGAYPGAHSKSELRTRVGDGVLVLNPEDFCVSIGLRQQAIAVPGGTGIALPATPLEYRRSLAIHNMGPGILYIGLAGVTTADGFPIAVNEKIAIDCQGTPNVTLYGVSDSTSDVRVLELA